MRGAQALKLGTGLATAGFVLLSGASAQDGGVTSQFSVSQSLELSDNLDFDAARVDGYRATTGLRYSYSTSTRISTLRFNLGGSVRAGTGQNLDLVNPSIRFSYGTGTKNTQLKASGSYVQDSVDSLGYLSTLTDEGDLELREVVLGRGSRTDVRANVGLDTGVSAPFGLSFKASHRERIFTNTTDPDLTDTQTTSASVSARFRVDDRINLNASASKSHFVDDDGAGTEHDTTRVSFGGQFDVRPDLRANASIYYNWNDYRGAAPVKTQGSGLSFGMTLDRPNGMLSANASTSVASTGRQYSARVSRNLDLQRGSLAFSLGAVKPSGEDWQPLASVRYNVDLPRGNASFRLSQSASQNSANQDVINSAASARYSQQINSVSRWNASLSFAQTNVIGAGGDTSRVDFGLQYRRELAQEWEVVVGYRHALAMEDSAPDIDANTVSLSIEKKFDWRY